MFLLLSFYQIHKKVLNSKKKGKRYCALLNHCALTTITITKRKEEIFVIPNVFLGRIKIDFCAASMLLQHFMLVERVYKYEIEVFVK